jgi:glycosyltransferase involved in cell wall biosynthesis
MPPILQEATVMTEEVRSDYLLLPGRAAQKLRAAARHPSDASLPLISCVMASRGRVFPAAYSIDCYRRQSYPRRELVITTAALDDRLGSYVRQLGDPSIRVLEVPGFETPGRLRNAAISASRGDIMAVWDDDDLSCSHRIALQYRAMNNSGATACFLARELLWWPSRRRLAVSSTRMWENSMLVHRADLPRYREDGKPGEDTEIALALRASRPLLLVDRPEAYVYISHGGNLCSADHFDMLFDHASRHFTASEYGMAVTELAESMPLAHYAASLDPSAGL